MRFVLIAFVASCILALIALAAPSRRAEPDMGPQSVDTGTRDVSPATVRRVRT